MSRQQQRSRLRDQYVLHIQFGAILALTLLIVAFQLDLTTNDSFTVQMHEQEAVEMTEIQQTEQENQPPPPPRPPVPQEVPNDQVIEQEPPNFDASLDMNERLETSTPPPAPSDDEETEEAEEEIFVVVEEQPECGGLKAVRENLEYPEFAQKAGIEGRVFVQFIVNEKGEVTNPSVTRGAHNLLNEAALNAITELECTAGRQRGQAVKVQMSMPVMFRLADKP